MPPSPPRALPPYLFPAWHYPSWLTTTLAPPVPPLQGLLGSIAELSAQQEQLERQLLSLDASLSGLAAAIPAAQAVAVRSAAAAVATASARLHCSLRLLGLSSQALGGAGASRGSSSGCGGGTSSSRDVLALELSLHNQSRLPLVGSWSLAVTFSSGTGSDGSGCSSGITTSRSSSSSRGPGPVVLAAPVGGLPAGAEWRQECQVPLTAAAGAEGAQIRVLLCHHSDSGAPCGSSSSSSMLLLHSVKLDPLHLLRLRSAGSLQGQPPLIPQQLAPMHSRHSSMTSGSGTALQAKLLLQLPGGMCGPGAAAGQLLQELVERGLSSQPLTLQQPQQPAPPCPAFNLLLQPPQQQPGSGAASMRSASSRAEGGIDIALSAQLLPGAGLRWASGSPSQQQLLQVTAEGGDAASLLACHASLCAHTLHMQQAVAAAVAAGTMLAWPRLLSGGVLLPAGAAAAAAAGSSLGAGLAGGGPAVEEAELEQALLQLRRLKEAAVRLRNSAGEPAAGRQGSAGQQQQQQHAHVRRQREELLQLVLAARGALHPVPVLMC